MQQSPAARRRLFVCAASWLWLAAGIPEDEGPIRDWVQQQGYPFEQHNVSTQDGRRLDLFRLPKPGAPAVLLQHGILDSAWGWVFNREFKALGFALHDAGYDIWMGNSWGNGYSQHWANGSVAAYDRAFWNFSFDDMARRDIPAFLDAISASTGQGKVAYVAHSQGTTEMLIAAIGGAGPELQDMLRERVSVFVALSPVAWVGHSGALILRALSTVGVQRVLWPLFPLGFLDSARWRTAANLLCSITLGLVCKVSVDAICGKSTMDHPDNIIGYSDHFPFGTSFKNIAHFAQAMGADSFQRYDYGLAGNLAAYGQATPPQYNMSGLAVPTALFVAADDLLADREDVARLMLAMGPSQKVVFSRLYEGFSHITWLLGSKQAGYYVDDVLKLLHQYHTLTAFGPTFSFEVLR